MPKAQTKLIVGLSGGVDSAVAALLLQQQGYLVEGLFMQNWEEDQANPGACSSEADLEAAVQVARTLNIKLHLANFAKEYMDEVFSFCLQEFKQNRTPNPDIWCNKYIKFKYFLARAQKLGAAKIATGHYARVTKINNQYYLLKALDKTKDQSYFLHELSQEQLQHVIFPLGELLKTNVRKLAKDAGFANHAKPDSTGICFIGERKFKPFLANYIASNPGNIITTTGQIIGKHDGLMFYTIGQRQGLGIGGQANCAAEPWYVIAKDSTSNQLIVAQGKNNPYLFASSLTATNLHWINTSPFEQQSYNAKIRYRQDDQECSIKILNDNMHVDFKTAQRAITPGQSIVIYDNEVCLGGGIIKQAKGIDYAAAS